MLQEEPRAKRKKTGGLRMCPFVSLNDETMRNTNVSPGATQDSGRNTHNVFSWLGLLQQHCGIIPFSRGQKDEKKFLRSPDCTKWSRFAYILQTSNPQRPKNVIVTSL